MFIHESKLTGGDKEKMILLHPKIGVPDIMSK